MTILRQVGDLRKPLVTAIVALAMLAGCGDRIHLAPSEISAPGSSSPPLIGLRIYHNPYQGVDWQTDVRLRTQLHDHVGNSPVGLRAYDSAQYDVMSLMTYSGVASMTSAWHERHWPPEKWIDPSVLAGLKHIKFFIPNGEEVGYSHITSPLMIPYIAKFEPAYDSTDEPWDYGGPGVSVNDGTQQAITLVNKFGGFSIVAHPVEGWDRYKDLRDFRGMEIYSGYVTYKKFEGVNAFYAVDRNTDMEANWDRVLARDDRVIGVAVNDHFGPDNVAVPSWLRDTGKTIVIAHAASLAAFADALRRGAVLAVKDIGDPKNRYPDVGSIAASSDSVVITAGGVVTWIAGGVTVASGPVLRIGDIPRTATYVRAVVTQQDGSTVYTQAFAVRSVNDTNGDGRVDAQDDATCAAVQDGADRDVDHVAACADRSRPAND